MSIRIASRTQPLICIAQGFMFVQLCAFLFGAGTALGMDTTIESKMPESEFKVLIRDQKLVQQIVDFKDEDLEFDKLKDNIKNLGPLMTNFCRELRTFSLGGHAPPPVYFETCDKFTSFFREYQSNPAMAKQSDNYHLFRFSFDKLRGGIQNLTESSWSIQREVYDVFDPRGKIEHSVDIQYKVVMGGIYVVLKSLPTGIVRQFQLSLSRAVSELESAYPKAPPATATTTVQAEVDAFPILIPVQEEKEIPQGRRVAVDPTVTIFNDYIKFAKGKATAGPAAGAGSGATLSGASVSAPVTLASVKDEFLEQEEKKNEEHLKLLGAIAQGEIKSGGDDALTPLSSASATELKRAFDDKASQQAQKRIKLYMGESSVSGITLSGGPSGSAATSPPSTAASRLSAKIDATVKNAQARAYLAREMVATPEYEKSMERMAKAELQVEEQARKFEKQFEVKQKALAAAELKKAEAYAALRVAMVTEMAEEKKAAAAAPTASSAPAASTTATVPASSGSTSSSVKHQDVANTQKVRDAKQAYDIAEKAYQDSRSDLDALRRKVHNDIKREDLGHLQAGDNYTAFNAFKWTSELRDLRAKHALDPDALSQELHASASPEARSKRALLDLSLELEKSRDGGTVSRKSEKVIVSAFADYLDDDDVNAPSSKAAAAFRNYLAEKEEGKRQAYTCMGISEYRKGLENKHDGLKNNFLMPLEAACYRMVDVILWQRAQAENKPFKDFYDGSDDLHTIPAEIGAILENGNLIKKSTVVTTSPPKANAYEFIDCRRRSPAMESREYLKRLRAYNEAVAQLHREAASVDPIDEMVTVERWAQQKQAEREANAAACENPSGGPMSSSALSGLKGIGRSLSTTSRPSSTSITGSHTGGGGHHPSFGSSSSSSTSSSSSPSSSSSTSTPGTAQPPPGSGSGTGTHAPGPHGGGGGGAGAPGSSSTPHSEPSSADYDML